MGRRGFVSFGSGLGKVAGCCEHHKKSSNFINARSFLNSLSRKTLLHATLNVLICIACGKVVYFERTDMGRVK
jgi:hypothetical protein